MAFAPGALLGGRFELHGVVGRGGTAEVWLATDRLRGERVALKLVHPHLAADPDTRRRLRREVQAASALRSPAALGPHDLHELDGVWALSMPFHPGQTLAERVATSGPLRPDEVRALGIRVATALADAHRAGVLHRDVTANNVLVGDRVEESVLTDFGLSRVIGGGRSTGLLGTAGYAAPEVYAGNRADPRSDLYGLGAVLYLALTGKPAFDPKDPMGALKAQLEDVKLPASSGPADLVSLIESLLRPDPAERPQGATEVLDALHGVAAPAPVRAKPRAVVFPRGRFTVVVKERSDQRQRRQELRRRALRVAPTAEDQLLTVGRQLWSRLREAIGVPGAGPALTPEQALHAAVADALHLPPEALPESPVVLERKFRLVTDVDEPTATALAERASSLGFSAHLVDTDPRAQWLATAWIASMVAGWVALPIGLEYLGFLAVPLMVAFTVVGAQATEVTRLGRGSTRRLPVAYARPPIAAPVTEAPTPSRGQELADRARAAIDALDQAAVDAELPDVALADLRTTTRAMAERADRLARDIDAAEAALAGASAAVDVAALHTRLERMSALERAGEAVDARERTRIERALAEHAASEEAGERLESELASATAALVEITSAAVRLRRELVGAADPRSGDELVQKLSREAAAAIAARREAARRAQVAGR